MSGSADPAPRAGEAEVSAWEARAGLGAVGLYVAAIVVSLSAWGALFAPTRTRAAWRASAGGASLSTRAMGDAVLARLGA